MTPEQKRKLARLATIIGAAVIFACTLLLVADYLKMRSQAPLNKEKVEAMEDAVQRDAGVAVELTAERERQTEQSLIRDSRNLTYAYILLAGAVLFLIAKNWQKSFDADPVITLETLVNLRDDSLSAFGTDRPAGRSFEQALDPQLELSFVDEIISREGQSEDAAVPILRAIQAHYGYLPDEALVRVCEKTKITPAQIAGTSTFYSQFRLSPVGRHLVRLCHGTACHVSGIGRITEELRRHLEIQPGADTDPSRLFTLEKVACLGCCSLAPVMMIDEETAGRLTPASACRVLHDFDAKRSE
jgi:NADH:ubiquinone oxidoreductase subunit E